MTKEHTDLLLGRQRLALAHQELLDRCELDVEVARGLRHVEGAVVLGYIPIQTQDVSRSLREQAHDELIHS